MESDKVLRLIAGVLSRARPESAATAFAGEIAALMGADEASVGFDDNGHAVVAAMSRMEDFQPESEFAQALGAAMDEAIIQQRSVVYPPVAEDVQVTRAHAALARYGDGSVLSVPMASDGEVFGAVTLMTNASQPLDKERIEVCEHVVSLAGPILLLKRQALRPWYRRLGRGLQEAPGGVFGSGNWLVRVTAAASVAALAALAFIPADYNVSASARLEGAIQASLVAPADGFLRNAYVQPGDAVTANQLLAELSEDEMLLERRKWESALAQHETAAPAALALSDRGQFIISEAKADEARAQIALIDTWLERGRIAAPFDGLVIAGDLMQSLGAPVKRGEVLLTIAPKGEYRLVVEVDDRDIAAVESGQRGEVVLGALTEHKLPFVVERVTPVASARDGRNFFEVFAKLDTTHDLLQPGLRGVARIHSGERPIGWIASRRLLNWWRLTVWSLGI